VKGTAMDALLGRAVDDRVVPGVVALVADRDGVVYEAARGSLAVDDGQRAQPDTLFWIASMTKAIVSVGALRLIERHELELDRPVADIVPQFGALAVLEGFDGDVPRLRPPTAAATVRHLLTHTSGAGYWFSNANLLRFHELTGVLNASTARRAALFDVPLVADAGKRWEYGTSTDWLGLVIEAVSGLDLATYCATHVLGPLGMRDTTFTPSAAQMARRTRLHARTPDGGLEPTSLWPPAVGEFHSGGAGAFGTGPDYMRLLRALLRDGELDGARVLDAATVELAFTDHLRGAPLPETVHASVPELMNDVPSLPCAQGWGLGFHLVLEDLPGLRRAGTADWAGIANCYYWIDRASGIAAVLLTQVLPFFDAKIVELLIGFEQAVYAS